MTVAPAKLHYTPEDLLIIRDGKHFELIHGQLREKPSGARESWVAGELAARITGFVVENKLGWVFNSTAGYVCFRWDANQVLKPDVSFVGRGGLPGERIPKGHIQIPPDLAVEVVSPNDLYAEVRAKAREYLRAGVRLVWLLDPETRTAEVHLSSGPVLVLFEDAELSGADVLPGFRCCIGDLFPPATEPLPEEVSEV